MKKIAKKAATPNPMLEPLGVLIGEWKTIGSHNYSEKEILKFHGMGKSSLPKLKKALDGQRLSFKNSKD